MNFHDSRSAEEIIAYRGRKVAVLAGIVVCGLLVWGLAPEPQPQFTATTDIPADWLPGRPLRSVGTGPPGARVAYVIGSMDGPATTVGPDGRWTLEWTSGNDVAPVLFLLPIGVDSPRVTVELPKPDPELSAKLEPAGAGKEGWRALVSGPPGLEVEARRGDDILGRCRLDEQGRCEILIRSSQGWGMLIVSNRPRLRYTFPRQHVQAPVYRPPVGFDDSFSGSVQQAGWIEVSGFGEANRPVTVFSGRHQLGRPVADGQGRWTLRIHLPPGPAGLSVRSAYGQWVGFTSFTVRARPASGERR